MNNGCGYRRQRRRRGCIRAACGCWDNSPCYSGMCPYAGNGYEEAVKGESQYGQCGQCGQCNPCRRRCNRGDRDCGLFLSWLPIAIAANGVIPLVVNNPCRDSCYDVNSGLITIDEGGTYLATYNVRLPEGATVDTTVTLNVDDASQSSAVTQIMSEGTGTQGYSAQAIFDADAGATVALKSSQAINLTDTSAQPLFSLSLVKLSD